jgi:hypothetical protein
VLEPLERSSVGDVVNEDPGRRIADVNGDNGSVKLLCGDVLNAQTYKFVAAVHNDNVAIAADRRLRVRSCPVFHGMVQKRGLARIRMTEKNNF